MRVAVTPITKLLPLIAVVLASANVWGAPQPYAIVAIGAGRSYRINEHGEVAGSITAQDGAHHAFIYRTGLDDLGNFGGSDALASGVNASGQVIAVYAPASSSRDSHGVIYQEGEVRDIGSLGKYPTTPLAINDSGAVVGYGTTSSGARHAFLFSHGKMADLGTLGGAISTANAINAHGVVAGWSNVAGGRAHAFFYSKMSGLTDAGVLSGGTDSQAVAINSNGVAVGFSTDSAGANHAVRFDSGKVEDLGLDGASETYAEDINDGGVVVGWASFADGSTRGIMFSGDRWVDLTGLLPADSGWTILTARSINDAGQITGEATDPSGASTVYLLSPSPFLSEFSPTIVAAGSADVTLTLQGFGFAPGSQALWNGQKLATTYISPTTLSAVVPADLIKIKSDARVSVANPGAADDATISSNGQGFHVAPPDAPMIGGLSTRAIASSAQSVTIIINGSNFESDDVAMLDGQPLATTYRSSTQLAVVVPAGSLTDARIAQILIDRQGMQSNGVTVAISGLAAETTVHTFPAGLQLISAPDDYTGRVLTSILDEPSPLLVTWSPSSNTYSETPDYPADTLHAGRAYWARFARPVALTATGESPSSMSTNVPLSAGWNMVGNPIASPTPIDSLQIVDVNGRFYSWKQAIAAGIVASPLYSYDAAANAYVAHASDTFDPYLGYWLHVTTMCSLVVTAVRP